MNKVTLCFLSCKRIDLFKKVFDSFWENCLDTNLIDSFIIIDDNSVDNDRLEIMNFAKKINVPNLVIFKNELKTLCKSFNLAFDICNTKYLFTIEDDWIFFKKNTFITESLEIFSKHQHVKKIIPDLSTSGKKLDFFPQQDHYATSLGTEYIIDEYRIQDMGFWASYSDRTGVIDVESCLKNVGYYTLNPQFCHDYSRPTTETDYAIRFSNSGFRTAYFKNSIMREISNGYESAFNLNNIQRHV